MNNRPLTYLAVPYSHPDPAVRLARFEAANRAAGLLMREGLLVFSPISHTHPIAEACGLPLGWDYWQAYDRAVLSCCSKVIVLELDGWQNSIGVMNELSIAHFANIEVEFMQLHKNANGKTTFTLTKHENEIMVCGKWIKDDPDDESNKE